MAGVKAGKVVHFEIPVDEGSRAVEFYSKAFGWEFERWGDEGYWNTPGGEGMGIGGALMERMEPNSPPIYYIQVDDIDTALEAIEASGGKALSKPMPIPGMGWMAYFGDTEGNKLGLFKEDSSATMPEG